MSQKPVKIVDAVIADGDRYLLVQTRKPQAFGRWAFPGGHVEPGEDPETAIRRELSEELSVEITSLRLLKTSHAQVSDETPQPVAIEGQTFLVDISGQIKLDPVELMDHRWLTKAQIKDLRDQLRSPWILPVIDSLP
jgi:8-oxo-dGTP diphosphatase